MRFLKIDLERYGPFTDTKLSFRPDAALHIVYGPNEAGKSSALAAITDLLFGFGARTDADFLHKSSDLRIAAEIVDGNATPQFIRRRKGLKNTLLDRDGNPFQTDALLPYLGSLTRDVFTHAFGLDADALRKGAEAIVSSDGEAGATLLAAASGLRDLSDLRSQLDKDAAQIFAPSRAKDRLFYQALDRMETARKAIQTSELRAPDWLKLREAIEAAEVRLGEVTQARRELAMRKRRLERLRRVKPVLHDLDALERALSDFAHLPPLSVDSLAQIEKTYADHGRHAADLERARRDLEAAQKRLAAIQFDEKLLQQAAEIERLVQLVGSFQAAQRDLPRVQADMDTYNGDLARKAKDLGLPDAQTLEARQPPVAALKLVELQIEEGLDLRRELAQAQKDDAELTRDLEALQADRAQGAALIDPAPLREPFQALGSLALTIEKYETLAHETELEAASLMEAAARLDPSVGDLDAMARTALPGTEAQSRIRKAWDEAEKTLLRLEDRLNTAMEAEDQARIRMTSLAAGRPVPSPERIAAARTERDALWRKISAHLTGANVIMPADLSALLVAFERQIALADQLADEAARDAERVAAHAVAQADLTERRRQREAADSACDAAAQTRDRVLTEWQALWSVAGVKARRPDEMATWLNQLLSLLARRDKLKESLKTQAQLSAKLAAATPTLQALTQAAGLPDLAGLGLREAHARLEKRITSIEETWNGARSREAQIKSLETRLNKSRVALKQATAQRTDWQKRFAKALGDIGLSGIETLEQAEAALEIWKSVPDIILQRKDRERRVKGMRRDSDHFSETAQELIASVAPDLVPLPPDAAIRSLPERLAAARDGRTRVTELQTQIAVLADASTHAERALDASQTQLTSLLSAMPGADLASTAMGSMPSLLDKLRQRGALVGRLAASRERLTDISDGLAEADLRADVEGFDPDAAAAELAEIDVRDEQLDLDGKTTFAQRNADLTRKAELELGLGAEVALQERRNAEAELLAAARDYSVLRIASLMLGTALERHRAGRQDPLMQRASILFRTLTGGGWECLDQTYGENDRMELVARRAGGDAQPIRIAGPGLSEGTRDQLYLALRLAYLESYAERSPAPPFIGDDLFASFDEARTMQGLRTLAALSPKVQPIIFTHHRHVADLALAELGDAADILLL